VREVVQVLGRGVSLGHFLAEHFLADGVHQQTRGHLAVSRVLFHQRAGSQDGGLVQLFDGHAVVQVLDGFGQDGFGIHMRFQADAGSGDQGADFVDIQRTALAVFGHVQLRCGDFGLGGSALLGALFHALGAVQHVGAGHIMLARTHQSQLDLVLDVFNMEGAAGGLAAHQCRDDVGGQLLDHLAHARRGRTLATVDGQEGLGHGDGNLGRFETDHGAVAADDAVFAQACGMGDDGLAFSGAFLLGGNAKRGGRFNGNFLG
jgi:hypothetical protein